MHRNTYVEINLSNITYNVKQVINNLNNYKYIFGVVKADCYGHNDYKVVKAIINGGCNYLCTATLDEALEIRKYNKQIPILCLGIIDDIETAYKNNITITISSFDYLNNIIKIFNKDIKCHIKINTGMNRLGINNKEEIDKIYNKINKSNLILEGLYTHIYSADNKELTLNQYKLFKELIKDINITNKIIHVSASEASLNYPKLDIANGCRLGIIMYGLINNNLNLKDTFKLYSEVIQINKLNKGDTLGYNANYTAKEDELIAVVPIGYADGIIRKNTGRYVYINNKKYNIVGNICMDMLFIKIDNTIKIKDKVEILKDIDHINYTANYLDTITYEIICNISKRVPRIYIN